MNFQTQQQQQDEIRILKRAFCEFFIKLLPSIVDPLQLIRDILLDETKTPQDILTYVALQSYGNIQPEQTATTLQKPAQNDQPKIKIESEQDTIPKPLGLMQRRLSDRKGQVPSGVQNVYLDIQSVNKKDMFVKQPSSKKLKIKPTQQPKKDEPVIEDVQKFDISEIKLQPQDQSFPQWKYIEKNKFSFKIKDELLNELRDIIAISRKHSTTLGCVYDKSFEINTSELLETESKPTSQAYQRYQGYQKNIQQGQQQVNLPQHQGQNYDHFAMLAQQDLQAFQQSAREQAARAQTLKGYSIYAKNKPKDVTQINTNAPGRQIII